MLFINRTHRLEIFPDQFTEFFVVQDTWRNFGAEKAGEFTVLPRTHASADTGEDVAQFAAVPAAHGLDLAMPAAGRTAADLDAVLAERTFEKIRLAHTFEIPLDRPADNGKDVHFLADVF